MSDYSASLQAVELSSTLWTIPMAPLAAALALALRGKRRERRLDLWLGLGGLAAGLLAALVHGGVLVGLPAERRFLLEHLWQVLRIGSLDLHVGLAFDPLAATLTVAALGSGLVAAVHAAKTLKDELAFFRFVVGANLAVGSAVTVFLASHVLVVLIGWAGVALAGAVLGQRSTRGRAFVIARIGDGALLAGIAVLAWALVGARAGGSFTPDMRAPLSGVQLPAVPTTANHRTGFVTMLAYPGSTVSVAGAHLCKVGSDGQRGGLGLRSRPCRQVARSPFVRLPVPPAVHEMRVSTGPGTADLVVEKLHVTKGQETQLAASGPTLVFREIADQLRMRDTSGRFVLADGLAQKRLWGLSMIDVAWLLLAIGAMAKSGLLSIGATASALGARDAHGAALVAGAAGIATGPYLMARLGFLLPMAPLGQTTLALAGAGAALYAGWLATREMSGLRIVVLTGVAQVGLAFAGVAVGAFSEAMLWVLVASFSTLALALGLAAAGAGSSKRPYDLRALGGLRRRVPSSATAYRWAALAAAAAPIPALGAFWARDAMLFSMFTARTTWWLPGWLLYSLAVLSVALSSFGIWRSYYTAFEGPRGQFASPSGPKAAAPLASGGSLFAALVALGVGLLGASALQLGGASSVSAFDGWLQAPPGVEHARAASGVRWGLLASSFGAPLLAWLAAKNRYGRSRTSRWDEDERQPSKTKLAAQPTVGLLQAVARVVVRVDSASFGIPAEPARSAGGAEPKPAPRRGKS